MRTLDRKLRRDVWRLRLQVISIALVMACGTMTIMGLRSTLASIQRARDDYYDRYHFADVFSSVQRAPASAEAALRVIQGVGSLEARIVENIRLDVPGLADPARARIVSIPETRRPMLNALLIRSGRWVAPGRDDEVLVSEQFARLNALRPGDTLSAVLNGRWQRLRIAGIAGSPEFVAETPGGGAFVDNRRFGILWASRRALETAFDMKGAFNDIAIGLAPGANAEAVKAAVDRILAPWGSAGAYGRADQTSAAILDNEFNQLRANATIFPSFFLIVAAFLLNVVLSRLVTSQRDEIAALKAFGYTDREVGAHYLAFAVSAIGLGALIGFPAGIWMGARFDAMYMEYFHFPAVLAVVDWSGVALGIGVSGGFALLGALGAVRRVVRLPPAEALHPETPSRFRPLLIERLGIAGMASPATRMLLRNLERRPLRTLSSIVGVALAIALLATGRYPYDAFDNMIETHFGIGARADVTVQFTHERPASAARELAKIPFVRRVEAFRSAAVRIRHGRLEETTVLGDVGAGDGLRILVDADRRRYTSPPGGALLTESLARTLHVRRGDTVDVELLTRGGPPRPLVVVGTVDEMLGYAAYMETNALHRFLREEPIVDGAYLAIDHDRQDEVFAALREMPYVAGASSRRATLANIDRQIGESMSFVLSLIVVSATVIAVGVVYNSARIALSERGRELATLRVLGFRHGEVSGMLLSEQAVVTVAALPFGLLFGLVFSLLLSRGFQTEHFHFPFVFELRSYLFAAGVVVAAAALTGLFFRSRVAHLDLVRVLKTRE